MPHSPIAPTPKTTVTMMRTRKKTCKSDRFPDAATWREGLPVAAAGEGGEEMRLPLPAPKSPLIL